MTQTIRRVAGALLSCGVLLAHAQVSIKPELEKPADGAIVMPVERARSKPNAGLPVPDNTDPGVSPPPLRSLSQLPTDRSCVIAGKQLARALRNGDPVAIERAKSATFGCP